VLPFIKAKKLGGSDSGSVIFRKPDESEMPEDKERHEDHALEAVAQEIREALNASDNKALSRALKAFFEICDSMPHEEGEHLEEDKE